MSIIIRRGPKDNNDTLIRKFQKKSLLENVVQEYRDREFHKTDAQKRQERRAEKVRKIRRAKAYSN